MSFNPGFKIFPAGIHGIILFLIRAFKYSEYVDTILNGRGTYR